MTLDPTTITQNPFTIVTIIAAPALLTNASSVLSLSTSTRFMKCIDRIHQFSTELEKTQNSEVEQVLRRQIQLSHRQSQHFLSALRAIYVAIGAFALACLFALLGASTTTLLPLAIIESIAAISLICGGIGALGFIFASYHLIKASNIANAVIGQDMTHVLTKKDFALLKHL